MDPIPIGKTVKSIDFWRCKTAVSFGKMPVGGAETISYIQGPLARSSGARRQHRNSANMQRYQSPRPKRWQHLLLFSDGGRRDAKAHDGFHVRLSTWLL